MKRVIITGFNIEPGPFEMDISRMSITVDRVDYRFYNKRLQYRGPFMPSSWFNCLECEEVITPYLFEIYYTFLIQDLSDD